MQNTGKNEQSISKKTVRKIVPEKPKLRVLPKSLK